MKATPAERVVGFLSFAANDCEHLESLQRLSACDWEHLLDWLDDSGLAFYFLQKLKDTNTTDRLPSAVLSRLERSFASNQHRVEELSRRFALLDQKFNDAGVQYVLLKGFSLIPEFCPYAPLRYQGDFDFLVDESSLALANRVLLELGYQSKTSRSSREFVYLIDAGGPARGTDQYEARAPHAVELHLDIWDNDLHGVAIPRLFSVASNTMHPWNGLAFPVLADEDAFLLQVLHSFHHLFTQWIRMSCLLEIAHFLSRRASDEELWSKVGERVGDHPTLREFVVVITELAARLFAAPVPAIVNTWGERIQPESRVWIEHYACQWAFSDLPVYQLSLFPRSKLVLFLRKQYRNNTSDASAKTSVVAPSRLGRIVRSIKNDPSLAFRASWWKKQILFRRAIFYSLATLRYIFEIPRWRWLNRAHARQDSLQTQITPHRPRNFAEF